MSLCLPSVGYLPSLPSHASIFHEILKKDIQIFNIFSFKTGTRAGLSV